MNAEDREYLEILKTPPLSVADDWLIARLEAEAEEELRLSVLATLYNDERIAAEARAEALEAECREERAQRQMAEDEVQRLREAIHKHLEPQMAAPTPPEAQGREENHGA